MKAPILDCFAIGSFGSTHYSEDLLWFEIQALNMNLQFLYPFRSFLNPS